MLKYTVKRLAQSLVTILLIATIVFLLMRCLPTDYYFTEEQLPCVGYGPEAGTPGGKELRKS